jgi:hypothetical protein
MKHYLGKQLMLQPIVFKSKKLPFWDFRGDVDDTRDMVSSISRKGTDSSSFVMICLGI